jgi:hypothetical protein
MSQSVKAMDIVGKGNEQAAATMTMTTNAIGRHRQTQAEKHALGKRLGELQAWAETMEDMKPAVLQAAKAYKKGHQAQAQMASAVSKAGQEVALLNATTQQQMYRDHSRTTMQLSQAQASYGGAGWSL